MEISI